MTDTLIEIAETLLEKAKKEAALGSATDLAPAIVKLREFELEWMKKLELPSVSRIEDAWIEFNKERLRILEGIHSKSSYEVLQARINLELCKKPELQPSLLIG